MVTVQAKPPPMHGALQLDQMFSARPVLGHGNYRGPLPGLYMCSAGTHPGGGGSGAPGSSIPTAGASGD